MVKVSLAMVIMKQISVWKGVAFLVAQVAGATIASAILRLVFPESVQAAVNYGANSLNYNLGITPFLGILLEATMTFTLVFCIILISMHNSSPRIPLTPLAAGVVVTAIILMDGPLTGASINPARSFGSALVGNRWDAHYVYWIGPLLGGGVAALFGRLFGV